MEMPPKKLLDQVHASPPFGGRSGIPVGRGAPTGDRRAARRQQIRLPCWTGCHYPQGYQFAWPPCSHHHRTRCATGKLSLSLPRIDAWGGGRSASRIVQKSAFRPALTTPTEAA